MERVGGADGNISCKYRTRQLKSNPRSAEQGRHFVHTEGELHFKHLEARASFTVKIQPPGPDDEKPANNLLFGVELSDPYPRVVKIKRDTLIVELVTDTKAKKQADALQDLMDKIDSEEKLSWGDQIKKAVMLHPVVNEDGEIDEVTNTDAVMHFISVFWKLLFSSCPPPHYGGGWPCFVASLVWIGVVTAVVAETAKMMGCVLNIEPAVTAITFVAIGTSVPDTFASRIAAQQERYADEAVGNVTGSNSVNVFLGLGLPWCISSVYHSIREKPMRVPAKGLDLSVALFIIVSLVGISVLLIRRFSCKGELGGTLQMRWISCIVFVCLWFVYIIISTLVIYGKFGDIGGQTGKGD